MAEQAPRKEMHLSPVGEALHVHLNRPDEYGGNKKYKTKLVLEGDTLDEFKSRIDKLIDDAWAEKTKDMPPAKVKKLSKHFPYEEVLDADGNETGKVAFKFAMNAEIKVDGEVVQRKPLLIDSKRQKLPPNAPPVFSGATIRVAFTTRPYLNDSTQKVSVTLDLQKVQVIKLQSRGERPDTTFDEVQGGWTPEASFDNDDAADTGSNEF